MTQSKSFRLHRKFTVSVLAAAVLLAAAGSVSAVETTVANGNYPYSTYFGMNASSGDASDNKVTYEGGTFSKGLVTGFAGAGKTERNETLINGVTLSGWAASGEALHSDANLNKMTVNGLTSSGDVNLYAGWAVYSSGTAKDNVLEFNDGTVSYTDKGNGTFTGGVVAAGYSSSNGEVSGNSLTIAGGKAGNQAYGGYGGIASGNTITMTGGAVDSSAVAGFANKGDSTGNRIEISGNAVVGKTDGPATSQYAAAGRSVNGAVTGNEAVMKGGTVYGSIHGGSTLGKGTVSGNTLTLSGGKVTNSAIAGYSYGDATGNTVTVTGGTVEVDIAGGATAANAEGNTVVFSGGEAKRQVAGATTLSNAKKTSSLKNNSVTMSGSAKAAIVAGGSSIGTAEANKVTIEGGEAGQVFGGSGKYGATGNTVELSGSASVTKSVYGGYSSLADATGNTVTVKAVSVGKDVIGGQGANSAEGNTVTIDGASISGNVFGGAATGEGGNAGKNTVTLTNSPTIGGTVWGGKTAAMTDEASIKARANASGNSLTVIGNNATAGNIAGFDSITFEMPEGTKSGDTMLHLTAAEDTYITGSSVSAKANGGLELKPGDKVYLIRKDSGNLDSTGFQGSTSGVTVAKGSTATLSGVMHQSDNDLVLEVVEENLKPGTKTIAESRLAMASLVNIATDLFVDETYHQIARDARKDGGLVPFVTVRGSNMRYSTGSHIDVDGFEMNAGLGLNKPNRWGRATAGAYFEYGRGHYTTVAEGVKAKGDSHYTGVALFAREDFEKGAYIEGTFWGGQVKGDYNSRVLGASFESKSRYFAGELGAGFIFNFSEVSKLDTYAKFLWSRIAKDEVKLSTGELYELDRVKSDRGRLGFRYDRVLNEKSTLYFGAAYQYEFAGEARAVYDGMSTAVPSLGGSSGFFELGATLKPNAASPWEFRLGATAWVGVNKGFTGHAVVDYRF